MAKSPILGGFSRSFSSNLSDNELINMLVEIVETKDAKVPGALYLTAGLDLIGTLGNGPIRGVGKLLDILYVVSGPEVYSLTANGVATMLGTVVDVPGPVSMFGNGRQLMIVDGVGGWLVPGGYPLTGGTITGPVTNPATGEVTNQNGVAGGLYAINDTITLLAATGSQSSYPILTVTSVADNPVSLYTLANAGTTYGTASGVATTAINGQPGVGAGLTLDITASQGVITAAAVSAGGGGTGYAVGDTGTINGANGCYLVTAVSAGVVTAVRIINPGTLYGTETGVPTATGLAVPPNIGTGFTLDITATAGPITASALASGGDNYAVGNVGYVSGGTGDATYLVTAIGATGAVTGFTITQAGTVNSPPLSFTQQSTSGEGSGFTLTSPIFGPFLGLVPVTLPFPNPLVGGVSDGFGLMVFQGQQNIAASNELDLSTWPPLSFGIADESPDYTVSLAIFHDEAYILKELNSEVWVDQGLANFAFAPISGIHMEYGCMAPFSPAIAGSFLIWLSRNDQGQGIVVATGGYDPKPISTQALIAEFDTYPNLGDAIGYARQQGGHVFYVLTFPEADKTWAYDVTASQMAGYPLWHRLASFTNGEWHRHLGNCFTPWRGAVNLISETTTYRPNSVLITSAELETASGLVGLPLSFSKAVFSVWLDIPDGTASTGITFNNGGSGTVSIAIQNDQNGTPQVAVTLKDVTNTDIVSASYDFTNWAAWVNILISVDTATQSLQVWANTISDDALIETELTATSIVWTSSNAIAASEAVPFVLAAKSSGVPTVGEQIAQLVVPSDAFGTPSAALIDWPRGKVYLLNSSVPSARVYDLELATQNPSLSANLPVSGAGGSGAVIDPVTGYLIMSGAQLDDSEQVISVNGATMALVGTFGVLADPLHYVGYPTNQQSFEGLACVGCGTLASGGTIQVGYAFSLCFTAGGFSPIISAIRTDNMTAAGFSVSIGNTAFCAGESGPSGGSVFIASASAAASVTLSAISITPGAETYNISSWPTANPHITSATIGTIAATAVDATATTISCANMGYDTSSKIMLLDVTTNGTAVARALLGVNPSTAAIIWKTTIASSAVVNLSACSISGQVAVLLPSTGADVITTATGALVASTFGGVNPTFAGGDDITGLIVLKTAFTSGAGNPTPVSGTPSSFTGFAIMTLGGFQEPPQVTLADLWFSNTAGFVDFTAVSNRRKFISSVGGAQNLGTHGSSPFGITPPVFLTNTGMPASFATNAGRGGSFIISGGTLAAGASDPPGSSVTTTTPQPNSPGDGVLGDFSSGNLYAFNPRGLTDNGQPRRWLRRWRALEKSSMAAQRFASLAIDVQTGIGVLDGAKPQVILRWSDDGGHVWSNERILAAGQLGATTATIKFNRLGATRRFGGSDRIFELSSSDPFLAAILDAEVDVS